MTTVRELLEKEAMERAVTEVKPHPSGERKVSRLRRLAKNGGRVAFVAFTPGSGEDRRVQSVILRDVSVKKTSNGDYIAVGRDLEHEERLQIENGGERRPYSKRRKFEKVFRAYRVDRIVNGTITG